MKCIVKLSFAAVLVASFACNGWVQDNIFFSTTNSLSAALTPGNATVNYSSLGQQTLYVWVQSASGDDITPPDTTITPVVINSTTNYVPGSAASISLNYTVTAGTSVNFNGNAADGAQNFAGSWSNSGAANATGTDVNGNNRATVWSSVSNFTFGANPSNVTATGVTGVSAVVTPTATAANTATGTSRGFAITQADGTVGANSQKSTANTNTFLLGSVTFTVASTGSSTLQIGLGSNGIFRGGDGTAPAPIQVIGAAYSYFNAAINVTTSGGRVGDLNADNAINAADIDILATDIRNGATFATKPLDDVNGDHVVNNTDFLHEIGSLVDINGGGIGGAHGTHQGDANLDGAVNGSDFGILASHFGQTSGWAGGDFDGNGVVNGSDFGILASHFGQTGASGQLSTVPEPTTLVLGGLGVLGLLAVRRKVSA